ncbi:MAG: S-layer homology domain-containing protein, partial [Candidatus Gracilibacteria bacterium]
YTVEIDEDVTNNGTDETAISAGLTAGTYVVAGRTLQIEWAAVAPESVWTPNAGITTTVRILITAGGYPTYILTPTTFTFSGVTAAVGPETDPSGTDTVTVSAAALVATVELSTNAVVGPTGATTINLSGLPFGLDTNDTIDITFPDYVDISALAPTTPTGTFIENGTAVLSCDDPGALQLLTCTVTSGTSPTSGTLIIGAVNGITTRYAGTTNITVFEIEHGGTATADIAIDADGSGLTDGTFATTLASLAADTTAVATVGDTTGTVTVAFTFPTVLAADDTIKLTFPTNYNISTMTTPQLAVLAATIGLDNNVNVAMSGQDVTITLLGAQGTGFHTISLEANVITPRYADTAQNLAVLIEKYNGTASGEDVAASAANTGIATPLAVTVAHAANAGIVFTNPAVKGSGTVVLTLSTGLDLAINDTITFTMPAWINVPTATLANTHTFTTDTGTFTCVGVNSTRVITCTVMADTMDAGTTKTITLTATAALTAVYANISTATDVTDFSVNNAVYSHPISADTSVAVSTTTVGALTGTNVAPQSLISGVESKNTISFTTATAIPIYGKISVTYPTGWSVAGAEGRTATDLSGLTGTWTASVSGQTVTFTQSGTGSAASTVGATVLALSNGIMPPSANGASGTYTITTKTAAGTATLNFIETDALVAADTILGGTYSSGDDTPATTTTTTATTTTTTTPATTATTTTTPATTTTTTTEPTLNPEPSVENTTSVETTSGEIVTLTDLPETFWATDVITAMAKAGIVQGNEDGTFKPNSSLNRAEASALLYRVMGLEEPVNPTLKPFTDVEIDQWYAGYVSELKTREVANGNPDGTYKPANSINRAEFLKLAMNLYKYLGDETTKAAVEALEKGTQTTAFKDLDTTAWYSGTVTAATEKGFIGGKACGADKCFDATAEITRAEATQVLYNMFGKMLQVELPTE